VSERTILIAMAVAAIVGAIGAVFLLDTLSEVQLLAYVGVAAVGAIGGVTIVLFALDLITTAGEVTGLSDPGSRFPHLRRFFGRFE